MTLKLLRVFIAVRVSPLSAALREVLISLQRMGKTVQPMREENLHITLRFLGGTLPEVVPDVAAAIADAARGAPPFNVELRGLGAYPGARRPRVLWIGADHVDPLHAIVERMRQPINDLGFGGDERAWSPHVTLGRVKGRPPVELFDLLHQHANTSFGHLRVEQIDVMLSELGRAGPVYQVARSIALKA